jgi:hypothetical protein
MLKKNKEYQFPKKTNKKKISSGIASNQMSEDEIY